MTAPKLSIVIPVEREEKNLGTTLSNYSRFFSSRRRTLPAEILVVVSAGNPKASKTVDTYAKKYSFVKKLGVVHDSGKGGAVSLGFSKAKGTFIGYFNADGSVTASEAFKLYEFIEETPWLDGVIGNRFLGKEKISIKRRLVGTLYNWLVRYLFRFPYEDTQCGAKIFRAKAAKNIGRKLSNTGWTFDANILLIAKYLNFNVLDQPVSWMEKRTNPLPLIPSLANTLTELYRLKTLELFHRVGTLMDRYAAVETVPSLVSKTVLIFAWRDKKHPNAGGSEAYIDEVAKRLAKNYKVILFTSKVGNVAERDRVGDVEVFRKGNFITVYIWAVIYYFKRFKNEVDFVIDVENGIPFFTPWYSTKPRLLLVHHVHKNIWFKHMFFPLSLIGYVLEMLVMPKVYRNTPVITVSPSSMSSLRKMGFKDNSIYLAYNSIPKRIGGRRKKAANPTLLYLGRLTSQKRLNLAINATKQLLKEFPDLVLNIAGTGAAEEDLRELVEKHKLEKHVNLLGFVSEERKWELMQEAWVFVMPSEREGWGITILEAASVGTPSVGFDVLGVQDAIRDNVTGYLAEDNYGFAGKIALLLRDAKLRDKMVKECKSWSRKMSWDSAAKVFSNVIGAAFGKKKLLADRVYPWELDLRSEEVTTILANK